MRQSILGGGMILQTNKDKLGLFMLAGAALFALLAAAGYYFMEGEKIAPLGRFTSHGFVSDMTYVDMPRITVSMSGGNGGGGAKAPRVRLDISLEVARQDADRMEDYMPRMSEKLSQYFLTLHPDDFDNPNGLEQLREGMLNAVNGVGAPIPVHGLVLRQLVVM